MLNAINSRALHSHGRLRKELQPVSTGRGFQSLPHASLAASTGLLSSITALSGFSIANNYPQKSQPVKVNRLAENPTQKDDQPLSVLSLEAGKLAHRADYFAALFFFFAQVRE
jgi:hypothetical protein